MIPINSMKYNREEKPEEGLKFEASNKDSKRRGDQQKDKPCLVQKTPKCGISENHEKAEQGNGKAGGRRIMAHRAP